MQEPPIPRGFPALALHSCWSAFIFELILNHSALCTSPYQRLAAKPTTNIEQTFANLTLSDGNMMAGLIISYRMYTCHFVTKEKEGNSLVTVSKLDIDG